MALDLVGHGYFVELSRVSALGAQKEVAGHLHGDGRAALTAPAREQVGQSRTGDAHEFDARVLVKAVVFGRENRVAHKARNLIEMHEVAALLAEFSQEGAVGAPDAQRHLGFVVGERIDRRQLRVDDRKDDHRDAHAAYGGRGAHVEAFARGLDRNVEATVGSLKARIGDAWSLGAHQPANGALGNVVRREEEILAAAGVGRVDAAAIGPAEGLGRDVLDEDGAEVRAHAGAHHLRGPEGCGDGTCRHDANACGDRSADQRARVARVLHTVEIERVGGLPGVVGAGGTAASHMTPTPCSTGESWS